MAQLQPEAEASLADIAIAIHTGDEAADDLVAQLLASRAEQIVQQRVAMVKNCS